MRRRSLALVLSAGILAALAACGAADPPTLPVGLLIEDVFVGTGAEARSGDIVTIHFVGRLLDGTLLDSSRERNLPFSFRLGAREVIAGWDLGIPGMRSGGKRLLTVPPSLAYGDQQVGPIPPNSTLRFEIDLLSVVSGDSGGRQAANRSTVQRAGAATSIPSFSSEPRRIVSRPASSTRR